MLDTSQDRVGSSWCPEFDARVLKDGLLTEMLEISEVNAMGMRVLPTPVQAPKAWIGHFNHSAKQSACRLLLRFE
jgi:hypothetical protein